ncbi:MAG TPA: ABC transporter permease [Steroidobacteraceae bacterium]|nr:ABC transporter permease [Steroidobacteraceae bacterium]
MKPRPIGGVILRQIYLLRGSPVRLFPMITWVAIDIVLWGFITRYLNSIEGHGMNFVPTLLGAVLLWDFCTRIMQGISTAFLEDVWSHNFLNLFASPLSIAEYVAGLVATSVLTSALGLAAMLALATLVFGLDFFSMGLALVAFLGILFIFGVTLGILGTGIVLRYGPASEWLLWPIPAVLAPFAAVFYPLSTLPQWMQLIARCLPPAYVFGGMRAVLAGRPLPVHELGIGALLSVAGLVLSAWVYGRVYRHAVRTGLLARYSAEGAS